MKRKANALIQQLNRKSKETLKHKTNHSKQTYSSDTPRSLEKQLCLLGLTKLELNNSLFTFNRKKGFSHITDSNWTDLLNLGRIKIEVQLRDSNDLALLIY